MSRVALLECAVVDCGSGENVYMHGTPTQELFSQTRRDFSNGCVRLEDPVSLAE